jgi:hypothetical protein
MHGKHQNRAHEQKEDVAAYNIIFHLSSPSIIGFVSKNYAAAHPRVSL